MHAIRSFFQDKQNIIIATKVAAFNPEAGLLTYYRRSPNVQITFLDSRTLGPEISDYDCLSTGKPTYFVAKLNDTAGLERFLVNPIRITNPYNPDYSTIYTLKSNCPPSKTAYLDLIQN